MINLKDNITNKEYFNCGYSIATHSQEDIPKFIIG